MTEEEQKSLQQKLSDAVHSNNAEAVKSLVKQGADVNLPLDNDGWTLLMGAAYRGLTDSVIALIDAGANRATVVNGRNAAEWATYYGHSATAGTIKSYVPETPDQVIFHGHISNRALEDIFNFATMERVTLIRTEKFGPIEAVYSKNFSELEDETMLRQAFNEHVKRGGKRSEDAVFSKFTRKLDKPSL